MTRFLKVLRLILMLEVCSITHSICNSFDDCPAPPPCSCGYNKVITCVGFGLKAVPTFSKSKDVWDIYLNSNNISSIPAGAFINVKLSYLQLDNNGLKFVDNEAFKGLENTLLSLHLSDNKLTSLPDAIGTLKNISYLNMKGNPLPADGISKNVLVKISDTLGAFHFGSPEMTVWPSVLSYLKIFELGLYDLPLEFLPESAFSGFEDKLSWLYIISSKLQRLPTSLNMAKDLYFLSLDGNENLSLEGISTKSFEGLSKVNWFQIKNETFKSLPNVFHEMTGLFQLDIISTPITNFDSAMLPKNSTISILTLNDSRISKVPSAISQMKSMNVLALNYNNITAIQDEDFAGLTKMTYVSVSNCPLSNVSRNALKSLTSMKYIAFDFTQLTTIPRAIEGIKFDIISLYKSPIVCTCESLGWMKHWPEAQQIGINGQCRNLGDSDLADYVRNEVPKCQN